MGKMPVKKTGVWKFFSSIKLAIWLLGIIAVFSLIGTVIPQNEEPKFYISRLGDYGFAVLLKTGLTGIYSSWWFLLSLVLLSLNLTVCLINRFSPKARALGSFISHLSILVILTGSLIGKIYGHKGLIQIKEQETVSSFFSENGKLINLGFSLRLDDFIYSENTDPKEKILIFPIENNDTCELHGRNKGTAPIPIASIGVIEGTESSIADTGYKLKVLRYLPDFVMETSTKVASSRSNNPNNPALELALIDKKGLTKKIWVFARYPEMSQTESTGFKIIYNWAARRPKDFLSKVTVIINAKEAIHKDIRVNEPLSFSGYTFFQHSYDNETFGWSGLQVVKDPGVPVVYAGFIMLILGLVVIFYVNPLIKI